jgi:hypothetical protein
MDCKVIHNFSIVHQLDYMECNCTEEGYSLSRFYILWALKEALVKVMMGCGITTFPLNTVSLVYYE